MAAAAAGGTSNSFQQRAAAAAALCLCLCHGSCSSCCRRVWQSVRRPGARSAVAPPTAAAVFGHSRAGQPAADSHWCWPQQPGLCVPWWVCRCITSLRSSCCVGRPSLPQPTAAATAAACVAAAAQSADASIHTAANAAAAASAAPAYRRADIPPAVRAPAAGGGRRQCV